MRLRRGAFLPNLITIGNGICGFAAIVKLLKVSAVEGRFTELDVQNFEFAAWLILLGMVFDVFDGQVARFSGKTSDLGAQLDSLCDLLTFGLAPALLVVRLNMIQPQLWQNIVWGLCLAYFVGALLRLARFTVDTEHDADAHVCFKGLPTPAAAGCVASLVLFYSYIKEFDNRELLFLVDYKESLQHAVDWIPFTLPVMAFVLGWTMVSDRIKFDHVASQILNRSQSFDLFVYLVFGAILVFILPELILPLIFVGYLVYSPTRLALGWLKGRSRRQALVGDVSSAGDRPAGGNGARQLSKEDGAEADRLFLERDRERETGPPPG